jgi:phospholipid/cholesterol/gamma-HCH transport system substrate-binding protein
MKAFSERNPIVIGAIGVTLVAALVLAALQYDKLPFVNSGQTYGAYFTETGGLTTGVPVQISGMRVGEVTAIAIDGAQVLVTFTVGDNISLGDRSEAAIKARTVLGAKVLSVTPRGTEQLTAPIPTQRTTPPYQLTDALGDLAQTIGELDTHQLSDSLATLTDTFAQTPPELRDAVTAVGRFADTLNHRDIQLRELLTNANKATAVLADHSDQIASLIANTNAVLAQLRTQSSALDAISGHLSALATQLSGFVADNRTQLHGALDKLNGVIDIVQKNKTQVQRSLTMLNAYQLSLGESVSAGPFFKTYITNLLPGQFLQPFIDAAFFDLGLDPNVLSPSALTDPQTGQPATPALPVPYPRTGQGGGDPRLTLPDAITGNPDDPRYPYRPPLPPPAPGGPPPGPPAEGPDATDTNPAPAPFTHDDPLSPPEGP